MSSQRTKKFLEAINDELEKEWEDEGWETSDGEEVEEDKKEDEGSGWRGVKDKLERMKGKRGKIAVMRHPDHIGAADTTEFWSHHEKVFCFD